MAPKARPQLASYWLSKGDVPDNFEDTAVTSTGNRLSRHRKPGS